MIEKFRIKQFCCCYSTRTGSLTIGILGWMGSLLQAVTLVNTIGKENIGEIDTSLILVKESESNVETILFIILIFAVSAILVIGVYKNNRMFIFLWLVIKYLECCELTIITVVLFCLLFVVDEVGPTDFIFVITGLLGALLWYCWICVWSFFMDLGERNLTNIPTGQIGQTLPMTNDQPPPYAQCVMEEKSSITAQKIASNYQSSQKPTVV